jgi:hypothetical protein
MFYGALLGLKMEPRATGEFFIGIPHVLEAIDAVQNAEDADDEPSEPAEPEPSGRPDLDAAVRKLLVVSVVSDLWIRSGRDLAKIAEQYPALVALATDGDKLLLAEAFTGALADMDEALKGHDKKEAP